jgi:hypothetical protein
MTFEIFLPLKVAGAKNQKFSKVLDAVTFYYIPWYIVNIPGHRLVFF